MFYSKLTQGIPFSKFIMAFLIFLFMAALPACAPTTLRINNPIIGQEYKVPNTPEAKEAEKIAFVVWHNMELYYLNEGVYNSNSVLETLRPPQGIKIELRSITSFDYLIVVSSTSLPNTAWFIRPSTIAYGANTN